MGPERDAIAERGARLGLRWRAASHGVRGAPSPAAWRTGRPGRHLEASLESADWSRRGDLRQVGLSPTVTASAVLHQGQWPRIRFEFLAHCALRVKGTHLFEVYSPLLINPRDPHDNLSTWSGH